jgi:hypothetical protein
MGLDMYLMKNKKYDDKNGVIYWRKANQIHRWFVENVQNDVDDCATYKVTKEQLLMLYDDCKEVMKQKNQSISEKILPTTSGFFFGSVDYDQDYYNDIQYTIDLLEKILKERKKIYYYFSSW